MSTLIVVHIAAFLKVRLHYVTDISDAIDDFYCRISEFSKKKQLKSKCVMLLR